MATVDVSFTPLPAHVRTARLVALAMARRVGVPEEMLDEVRLAVGEACSRAVGVHASRGSGHADRDACCPTNDGRFTVEVTRCRSARGRPGRGAVRARSMPPTTAGRTATVRLDARALRLRAGGDRRHRRRARGDQRRRRHARADGLARRPDSARRQLDRGFFRDRRARTSRLRPTRLCAAARPLCGRRHQSLDADPKDPDVPARPDRSGCCSPTGRSPTPACAVGTATSASSP